MKSMIRKWLIHGQFLAYFLLMAGLVAVISNCADNAMAEEKTALQEGSEWFQSYCVLCHGAKADGKGNMASLLTTQPLNLTTIAKRRNGIFPDAEIAKIIANIENVPGHSKGGMPIWWETFKKSENITDEKVLREKIDHIVAYLKTIQQ